MHQDYDSIYSPETTDQSLALARRQVEQQVVEFKRMTERVQAEINQERAALEVDRTRLKQEEAATWAKSTRVEAERVKLENQAAVVKRDQEVIAKRGEQLRLLEEKRRRNRSNSLAFIEDSFSQLSPRTVVENLTNSSLKIRKHAMDNVSACIAGFKDAPPTFVRFTPQDIAPDILPKLHQLLSTSGKPVDSTLKFAEDVVSSPPVAKALALGGQCVRLSDYIVETNGLVSHLAVCSFRRMVGMETSVVKPAYEALSLAIPNIPDMPDGSLHPAVEFIKEVAPKIVEDCFNTGLWLAVTPLVRHHIAPLRVIALRKIVILVQHSDRNQHGVVKAHILGLLDSYYQSFSPPLDVVDFLVELLPLVAERLCHTRERIQWLLTRLGDSNAKITAAVISAFRACLVKADPAVLQEFVKVDLLKRLSEPPTQQSHAVSKLVYHLLPALAIPYTRAKMAGSIIAFLDHGDSMLAEAGLSACMKIVDSTAEDRSHLFSVFSKLSFAKESTLKLCDRAMPAFCQDWAAAGEFGKIVRFVMHPEPRIRLPAQQVWRNLVCNSSSARSKIAQGGLLGTIFELCNSQYEDAVLVGAACCSPMALEVVKDGVNTTRQLVELLSHPNTALRQAALRGIQIVSESGDANCRVLLEAGTFRALNSFFVSYPKDPLDNGQKVLVRLAPLLYTSPDSCSMLLELLESSTPLVEYAARAALATITAANINFRETLRNAILRRLQLPTETLIEFAAKAIQDWIGPDLAHLNDFTTFFGLVFHSDRRIQTAALIALKQRLSNVDHQESLEKANITLTLRQLANSDNPEALDFVMVALRILALSLVHNGHCGMLMDLLGHNEPKVCEGAAVALETIASGSIRERKLLLQEDVLERLTSRESNLDPTKLHLLSSIIPKLLLDYLEAGKVDLIFGLIDHPQQQIRSAATKSVPIIAGGTEEQRTRLRNALLPRLDEASPLLREVASECLSRSIAHDLLTAGDFIQTFRTLHNEDPRIRAPVILQLRIHIQGSDEAARGRLVDAGILPALLQAYTPAKDDLLDFISACALPLLGSSFTQNDGGATLFPLLTHTEPRIRTRTIQALKNAIDSRYGNMNNLADAFVIEALHPLSKTDDGIRDLWCQILPKVAPFVVNRSEIDMLFKTLGDERTSVREAASEAISIMAKTSEISRSNMFPTLLQHLEHITPASLALIAQVVSLSGSAFISHGKEGELLYLILNGTTEIATAALEATVQLLAKGGSFEHDRLMKADVLTTALALHDRRSRRQQSLKLLHSIVSQLSHAVLLDEAQGRAIFSLFDDPDPGLSTVLYQTWSNDPRVYSSSALPELLPLLFDENRLRNSSATALLRELAPYMVPQLVKIRRLDIIVKALMVNNANITRAFLQETCTFIEGSNENEKGWFVSEPLFVSTVGSHLKGRDPTMRREASAIIQLLSKGSSPRSGKIMNEGIGRYLSWVAVNGEKVAQQSSLHALYALFMAAPDHAERLVADSLPALCDILGEDDLSVEVYLKALRLLKEIVHQSSHSVIISSGITTDLVRWLSVRHSVTDTECKSHIFRVCEVLAQHSNAGRQALIDAGVLPELVSLAVSHLAAEVVTACKILKALAHTGTFVPVVISAGLEDSMKRITSPFRKSTLEAKEDKRLAQTAAKEALDTLKSSKASKSSLTRSQTLPKTPSHSRSDTDFTAVDEEGFRGGAYEGQQRHRLRRSASEAIAFASHDDTEYEDDVFERPSGQRTTTVNRLHHSRSLSDSRRLPTARLQQGRLSVVNELQDDPSGGFTEEELDYVDADAIPDNTQGQRDVRATHTARNSTRLQASNASALRNSNIPDEISEIPFGMREEESDIRAPSYVVDASQRAPPSYRTTPSVAGTARRRNLERISESTAGEFSARDSNLGSSRTAPPSYKPVASVTGSIRRR